MWRDDDSLGSEGVNDLAFHETRWARRPVMLITTRFGLSRCNANSEFITSGGRP